MKSDLDYLMKEKNLDAIMIFGDGRNNPAMVYLTGGGHFSSALCLKMVDKPAILIHEPMEREEAARTGLRTINLGEYPINNYLSKAHGNDPRQASAYRLVDIMNDVGFSGGSIAIYGLVDISVYVPLIKNLEALLPGLSLQTLQQFDVLSNAMITKDDDEIARVRNMGRITTEVVAQVQDFLCARKVRDRVLYLDDENPLCVGHIKNRINLWLAERGAENPHGTIFSLGRDAGIPHNSGQDEDVIMTGIPIVFDIFPCEAGGGYHYDFTRTWSLGYATDEVLQLYEDVYQAYTSSVREIKVGQPFSAYQELVCDLFNTAGHPTVRENPATEVGYVHTLGHGLGLRIHEKPFSRASLPEPNALLPGMVFTVEPGLYYPEKGMGVRIEDTFYMAKDGVLKVLAEFPHDLVVPMKG
ncbi:MAG: aminopeptidase P family protein [Anaerolineae bacterium]|nr:aminopeptidase P family protein [Anaerolineae bacterium]NPV57990.1 aminopeptidase P family protein [Anaerolineae bacterium]